LKKQAFKLNLTGHKKKKGWGPKRSSFSLTAERSKTFDRVGKKKGRLIKQREHN